ncbi:MAG TPA: hypothetical protein VMV81_00620, partial [Phycisphaerae bacterium]|nr:hypothetical protein [Phycisphaerae bacterium]
LRDSSGQPILAHPHTEEAVRNFLQRSTSPLEKEERDKLLAAVHPLKRDKPRNCTDCHTASGSLIDFTRAGYPAARIQSLTDPVIFRMIEHISSGQAMNLPNLMSPTSQPSQ